MSVGAKSGHVTTAFSQTELLVALYYGGLMRYDAAVPEWAGRDRFILSKGQGGIGLYPILADVGFFPRSELDDFAGRGNMLGVHAEWNIPGIEVITGSLGHGLPMATGMAQAAIMDGRDSLVICFLGDAELFEGSNWEAAFFAGHKGYTNLVCIVDRNGQGVLGPTDPTDRVPSDNPSINPVDAKFEAFGFETRTIDGHSFEEIFEALGDIRDRNQKRPLAIIANTQKGKGSSVMEGKRMWHYRVPSGTDLETTQDELSANEEALASSLLATPR
jgi:transketolase